MNPQTNPNPNSIPLLRSKSAPTCLNTTGHVSTMAATSNPLSPSYSTCSLCDTTNSIFFVEVKSKNDVLSKFQLCWIRLLHRVGIPVEIAKIINDVK